MSNEAFVALLDEAYKFIVSDFFRENAGKYCFCTEYRVVENE